MMETFIAYFHTSLYIPAIQKLIFHFPHVRIMGTSNYGNTHHKLFKRRSANKYVLCSCDYAERVVASFSHQM